MINDQRKSFVAKHYAQNNILKYIFSFFEKNCIVCDLVFLLKPRPKLPQDTAWKYNFRDLRHLPREYVIGPLLSFARFRRSPSPPPLSLPSFLKSWIRHCLLIPICDIHTAKSAIFDKSLVLSRS